MEKFLRDGVDLQVMAGSAIAGDAHFFDDATTPTKVRSLLDSSKEADKLKGMKLLLAMLSKGRDIPEFFPDVVKNVVVKSIEVKKMVYIYLVHYADFDSTCREIALLSINTFQKDMNGSNQLIRGLALRVMTSIRVPEIIQIQLLAVRKCATDSSPYVRKCAANALPKIFKIDKEQLEHLKAILDKLLRDSSTMVLGSAVTAFNEICPTSYDILHRNYRKLCHLLADMDEWTQVTVLEVMTRYVRNQFTDPAPDVAAVVRLQAQQRSIPAAGVSAKSHSSTTRTVKRRKVKKAFYSDEEDQSEEEVVEIHDTDDHASQEAAMERVLRGVGTAEENLDPDHALVLKSSLPLLKSRNSGVVLGVCSLHYYCGTQNIATTTAISKALVRILRNRREVQYVVLGCINTMAAERPSMFRTYVSDFFMKPGDPLFNKLLKLEILSSICCKENTQLLLREMQIYIKDSNVKLVCAVVKCIGRIASADPAVSDRCIEGLMHLLLCSKVEAVIADCVVVLRQLLQQNTASAVSHRVLRQLVKLLITEDGIEEPVARSSIVWLVGEFHSVLEKVAPDVLRILAIGFVDEATETKAQILNLATKLSLRLPDDDKVQTLMTYVLEMSRADMDVDLRDRSRFMTALMGMAPPSDAKEGEEPIDEDALAEFAEHAAGIMLAPKLPPVTFFPSSDESPNFTVGTMSSLLGYNAIGYEPLVSWPAKQPDVSVREYSRTSAQEAEDEEKHFFADDDKNSTKKSQVKRRGSDSSSSDEDPLAVFNSKNTNKKADSSSDSESESASSKSSKSESESASETEPESSSSEESDSGSSEDEKPVARVPLAQQKIQSVVKPAATVPVAPAVSPALSSQVTKGPAVVRGVRKVVPGRKKDAFSGTAVLEPAVVTSLVEGYDNMDITAAEKSLLGLHQPAVADEPDTLLSMPSAKVKSPAQHKRVKDATDELFLGSSKNIGSMMQLNTSSSNLISSLSMGSGDSADDQQATVTSTALSTNTVFNSNLLGCVSDDVADNIATIPFTNTPQSNKAASSADNTSGKLSHHAILSAYNNVPTATANVNTSATISAQRNSGIAHTQAQVSGSGSGAASPMVSVECLSEPKVLLKPEMGGGLSVTLVLRNNAVSVAYVGAISTYLNVRNTNKDRVLRRVKISFPVDLRKTAIPDIPLLGPEQDIQIPLEMVLSSIAAKQVKVDIRCDQGAYVGLLVVNDWDLLLPFVTTSAEFEVLRKRLRGFNELSKSYPIEALNLPQGENADCELELINRVRRIVNVYLVQGAGVGELMFAGSIRKGLVEEKAYITITSTAEQVTVQFNCEDVVLSTGLSDAFRKLLPQPLNSSSISL